MTTIPCFAAVAVGTNSGAQLVAAAFAATNNEAATRRKENTQLPKDHAFACPAVLQKQSNEANNTTFSSLLSLLRAELNESVS